MILCFIRIPDQIKKGRTKSVLPNLHRHLNRVGFISLLPQQFNYFSQFNTAATNAPGAC
ncbi:uncharacterized protein K460DRAFT_368414 [Cucurbitaria berberidis CBS 394.84]|uniref:Uncharacterized protein n=1 Tax=Cucurbitaria berberidis CBS 394.84 TaxID=1168544 RepID=A0A9P4GDA9_9PLEO|nr:uncharacterized protein K460DRAFT_368414 [Cucurbitaria berberidis CBS 394.84]KAF1843527.1 hypothetical protein K460DRAFT_368414 [Cucurbitaria berberidis CBS 394.84]